MGELSAAIVTDSILSRIKSHHKRYLKRTLRLHQLHLYPFPGKGSNYLLGKNSFIYKKLQRRRLDLVLISVGQNDVSSALTNSSVNDIATKISNRFIQLLNNLTLSFQDTKFVLFPLTLRTVCVKSFTRFPQSKRKDYITKVNKVVKKLMYKLSNFDIPNVFILEPKKLWKSRFSLLEKDGIHLTTYGLGEYLQESMALLKSYEDIKELISSS